MKHYEWAGLERPSVHLVGVLSVPRPMCGRASLRARGPICHASPSDFTGNDSGYVAGETYSFAREIGLEPLTMPLQSPQSNGMTEAVLRTTSATTCSLSVRDAEATLRQHPG